MAAVGLMHIVSETTAEGRLVWRLDRGRYRLAAIEVPSDLADLCASWVEQNHDKWRFAGRANVDFDAAVWRELALAASGLETSLWCAVASDAVWHRDGKKLKAAGLEYAHGCKSARGPGADRHGNPLNFQVMVGSQAGA